MLPTGKIIFDRKPLTRFVHLRKEKDENIELLKSLHNVVDQLNKIITRLEEEGE